MSKGRHWLRFPLRTLLILTALVAVVLAIFNAQTKAQRITKEIEALHGQYGIKQSGPAWIRDWFGGNSVGPFDSISSVGFIEAGTIYKMPDSLKDRIKFNDLMKSRDDARNDLLKNLSGLHELQELDLSDSTFTDDGIRSLTNLPQLRVLKLRGLIITDASLLHVTTFLRLEDLDVGNTKITDQGIADLSHLIRNLRYLRLGGTIITDAAIASLRRMRTLEYLDLSYTDVSEKAINELRLALPGLNIKTRR